MLCCDFKCDVVAAYQSYDQRQTAVYPPWVEVELITLLGSGPGADSF